MHSKTISPLAISIAGSAVALIVVSTTAQAQYLDPGSGSIIVQALVGGIVGAAALIKIYWNRISTFFMARQARRRSAS